MLKISFQQALT